MGIHKNKIEKIFGNGIFELPLVVGESNYLDRLKEVYKQYVDVISGIVTLSEEEGIKSMCNEIVICIEEYHLGYPHRAYETFNNFMKENDIWDMVTYKKTGSGLFLENDDPLRLYRVRHVRHPEIRERKELFHTPLNLRSNIGTCRYSISGYPSLYLGTSLKLCLDEVNRGRNNPHTYASKFKINRKEKNNGNLDISVLEFGIKPSDFFKKIPPRKNEFQTLTRLELLDEINLKDSKVRDAYIKWYPLYAACSFIRKEKTAPFASEYIIPQLLMQWLRIQSIERNYGGKKYVKGLRYFSCSSKAASERGMNYVFPVSDKIEIRHNQFCELLAKSMMLTNPLLIDRSNIEYFERKMAMDNDCRPF